MSTRLRAFIIVSIIIHLIVGVSTVVPYVVRRYLEKQRAIQEQQAREDARKKAEIELQEASRATARDKILEALKTDAHDLLSENLDEIEFEDLWEEMLQHINIDVEELVRQLEGMNFEISAADLEALIDDLRSKELETLLEMLNETIKQEIAAKILEQVKQSVPEFEKEVLKALGRHGVKTRNEVAKIIKKEERRRQNARSVANRKLAAAENQVKVARAANKSLDSSVEKSREQLSKIRIASSAADKALSDAIDSLKKANAEAKKMGKAASDIAKCEKSPANGQKTENPNRGMKTARKESQPHGGDNHAAALNQSHQAVTHSIGKTKRGLETASRSPTVAGSPKARKEVANALAAIKKTTASELPQLSQAVQKIDTDAISEHSEKTSKAIGKLIAEFEASRRKLNSDAGTLDATAERHVALARTSHDRTKEAIIGADKQLGEAAHQAHIASESKIGIAVSGTQKELRGIANTSVSETGSALQVELKEKDGEDKTSFSAPPEALARRRADRKLESAQKSSGESEKRLDELSQTISELRQNLSKAGKQFARRASTAVKSALSPDSRARKEAGLFFDKTMKESVAENFRKRTEGLAAAALKQKKLPLDKPFVDKVGQMAVNALLRGRGNDLKVDSFDALTLETAEAFGLENTHDKHGGGHGEEEGDGRSGGQEAEGDREMSGEVGQGLANQVQAGIFSALSNSQSHLKLPSLSSLGGESPIGFKLVNAIKNAGRPVKGGSKDITLIDLSRDLSDIGMAKRSGFNRVMLFKGRENIEVKYKENISQVIEDREIDELILNAPEKTTAANSAQGTISKMRNAYILVSHEQEETAVESSEETEEVPTERKLYQPRFKSFAYGGAPLALEPPVIDGDLSDWKDVEEFKLRGIRKKALWPGKVPPALDNNRYLMVQWNQKGFYFAYRMVDARDNTGQPYNWFWENDSLEIFFDFANKRPEKRTKETQQFWFWPVGSRMKPEYIGGESNLNTYVPRFRTGGPPPQARMAVKRFKQPRGYHVEVFLPVEVFLRPDLRPGRIIAFNFSINNGEELYFRWTANLGRNISVTPSLWGDLVLLGTDAEVAFVKPGTEEPLAVIVPGEPIGARIKDIDMNLSRSTMDKVEITFRTQNRDSLTGFFEETGKDTGIFAGSIDTELLLLQGVKRFRDAVLQVTGGEIVEILYLDQARRYGERNFEVRQGLPVGLPMLQVSGN